MQKAACICPASLYHDWMNVIVETGAARSQTQQIWMSRQCLGSLFLGGGGFNLFFSAEANGKETIIPSGCDPEL